jgi:hypothetical protein
VAEAFGKADDDEFIIGDGPCSSSSSSSSGSSDSDAGEAVPRLRQIFVCSRTHSQLQQVTRELIAEKWGGEGAVMGRV